MKLEINFTPKQSKGLIVDYWIATCFDCRASGETPLEALEMLVDLMKSTEKLFNELDDDQLGPWPLKTKQMLDKFRQGKL